MRIYMLAEEELKKIHQVLGSMQLRFEFVDPVFGSELSEPPCCKQGGRNSFKGTKSSNNATMLTHAPLSKERLKKLLKK